MAGVDLERQCARPAIPWSDSERADATVICRLLDGQPLALELAAAQSSRLSLPEIRRDLERGLRLLAVRRAGVPVRQQSMASVIAWSYGRLTPNQNSGPNQDR